MAEYGREQSKQESRAIAYNGGGCRQLKEFVDNSKSNQLIQRATFQHTGIQRDIAALAAARRSGGYPQLGVSAHNFAVGEGYPRSWACSNAQGHSEARAAANTLGILAGQNIEILSERAPCASCQNDMRDIENTTHNNVMVTVSYLVNNDAHAVANLRNVYVGY